MKVVWKYQLMIEGWGPQALDLPEGYRVIACQLRDGLPTLWVECDPDAAIARAILYISATGDEVPEWGRHLGTLQLGNDVLHIYGHKGLYQA